MNIIRSFLTGTVYFSYQSLVSTLFNSKIFIGKPNTAKDVVSTEEFENTVKYFLDCTKNRLNEIFSFEMNYSYAEGDPQDTVSTEKGSNIRTMSLYLQVRVYFRAQERRMLVICIRIHTII